MDLFKKQIKSQTCIVISYKITLNEKNIEQIQNLTENYAYTETAGKKILYLPAKEKQFIVDAENKQLKELDLSAQMMQMNQIKAMIGEVEIKEKVEGEIKHILIQNSPESQAKLKVELQIAKYPELEQTVFKQFNEFQQNMQMFRVVLDNNEITKLSESVFSINGQEQKSIIELTEIEKMTENIETFDGYCNYKIVK